LVLGENFEKGMNRLLFDVEGLEVGGHDPQEAGGAGNHFHDDPLVDVFIEDEFGHRGKE
jgi:hypothetical protein